MYLSWINNYNNITLDLEENKKPNPYRAKYIMTANLKSLLCTWCYFLRLPILESPEEVAFFFSKSRLCVELTWVHLLTVLLAQSVPCFLCSTLLAKKKFQSNFSTTHFNTAQRWHDLTVAKVFKNGVPHFLLSDYVHMVSFWSVLK